MSLRTHSGGGSVRRSLALITIAGSLAMVYSTAVSSPATIDYFRGLGATEFHFSLLGGLPLIMVSLQFVGAALTNQLRRRKPVFMVLNIVGRLMYLPIAFLPLMYHGPTGSGIVPALVVFIGIASACANLITPLWLSWMGDVIPQRRLSTFWGQRHAWMHATWTTCYLGIALFARNSGLDVNTVFRVLVVLGCVAGVADILLFIWVREPEPDLPETAPLWAQIIEPLRNPTFRSFLVFSCAWSFAVSWAAPFMQLYVMGALGVSVWQTTLIWCVCGVGSILAARTIGRIADRHGNRPLLVISISLKSMIVIVFLLLTPGTVRWVLPIAFLFDSMLNSLTIVANNGYLLKGAPPENRAMFVAAMTGLAGICGGLGAMASGSFLEAMEGMSWHLAGRDWNKYQAMFAIGVLLRWWCILLVRRIREPESSRPAEVLDELGNVWPFQVFLFPVELGRKFLRFWDEDADHDVNV